MKHFEQLWEEAEQLSLQTPQDTIDLCQNLKKMSECWCAYSNEERADSIGTMLFQLCALSARINVNVYAALNEKVQDEKSRILDAAETD